MFVAMDDQALVAPLVHLMAGATYAGEEAVIPFSDVSAEDAAKTRIGSIFRWVIGYGHSPDGTRNRTSQIVFPERQGMGAKVAQSFDS